MNTELDAKRNLNGYEKVLFPIVNFLAVISGIALTLMMLLTAADVIARFVFSTAIIGAFELVEFMMAVVVPLALCYCEKKREHICVDLIVQNFSIGVRRWFDLITSILTFLFYIVVAAMCWVNVFNVKDDQLTSSVLLLEVWPWTIPSAIGFTLLFLLLADHIAKVIKTIINGEGETV